MSGARIAYTARMRRLALAWLLAALCPPAAATEQGELLGCFEALGPVSAGFGRSIGLWEWPSEISRPTVVVTGQRGGAEGMYVYSEDEAYFVDFSAAPPWPPYGAALRKFPFQIGPLRPGRGVFHCLYEAVAGEEQREISCDSGGTLGDSAPPPGAPPLGVGEKYYQPLKAASLPRTSVEQAALRMAVLSRVMSAAYVYSLKAAKYGKALQAHKRRLAEGPGALAALAGLIGVDLDWEKLPPSPPDKAPAREALQACAEMSMSEELAGAARAEIRLLDNYPLPR